MSTIQSLKKKRVKLVDPKQGSYYQGPHLTLKNIVRFVLVDIKSRGSNATIFQSLSQRRLIHQAAPGRVHQESSGSHLLNSVLVDQMMIVLIKSAMKGYTIRLEQQILHTQKKHVQSLDWSILSLFEWHHLTAQVLPEECRHESSPRNAQYHRVDKGHKIWH